MKRLLRIGGSILMFSFLLGLFNGCSKKVVNPGLRIKMYDIGKADCFLLQVDDKNIMIDTGLSKNKDEVLKSLEKKKINKLDYLILTHMDKDHIGSSDNIIETVKVDNLVMPNQIIDSKQYRKLQEAIEAKGLKPIIVHGEELKFETTKGKLVIQPGEKDSYEQSNDYSLMTSLTYGEKKFLFAGDAEAERLGEFITSNKSTYDFVKIPHHGRVNDNSKKFISDIKPKYAVITSDRKNEPSKSLLNILDDEDVKTYLTIEGEIDVLCDGKEIEIDQKN